MKIFKRSQFSQIRLTTALIWIYLISRELGEVYGQQKSNSSSNTTQDIVSIGNVTSEKVDKKQLEFNWRTQDIEKINKEKEEEERKKLSIVKKDLESRLKIEERSTEKLEDTTQQQQQHSTLSPQEVQDRDTKVKQDLESRIQQNTKDYEYEYDYRQPMRRSDYNYYDEEPMEARIQNEPILHDSTTEVAKEESFFSIFESLFGSDEDEKKSEEIKEIKNVGEMLKPVSSDDYQTYDYTTFGGDGGGKNNHKQQQPPQRYDTPNKRLPPDYYNQYGPRPAAPGPQQQQRPTSVYKTQESPVRPPIRPSSGYQIQEEAPGRPPVRPSSGYQIQEETPVRPPVRPSSGYQIQEETPVRPPVRPSSGYQIQEETPVRPPVRPLSGYQVQEETPLRPNKPELYDRYYTTPTTSTTTPVATTTTTTSRPVVREELQTKPYRNKPERTTQEPYRTRQTTTVIPKRKYETVEKVKTTEKPIVIHESYQKKSERPRIEPVTVKPVKEWAIKVDEVPQENLIDRKDEYYPRPAQNEIKLTERIQDNANFYNFINLPVHYSNKDTAIPLISSSYANTKIQGLGASKYNSKNTGDKYSNHKYESTTKKPTTTMSNPWTRRTTVSSTTRRTQTTARPSTTPKLTFEDYDYSVMELGGSAVLGGYGNKEGVEEVTTTTRRPQTTTTTTTTTTRRTTTSTTTTQRPTTKRPEAEVSEKQDTNRVVDELNEYDYDAYPAQVYPVDPKQQQTKGETYQVYPSKQETKLAGYEQREDEEEEEKPPGEKPTKITGNFNEYEYYDYDDSPTTKSAVTERPQVSEKVAVVVPMDKHDFHETTTTTSTTTTTERTLANHKTKYEPAPVHEDTAEEDVEEEEEEEYQTTKSSVGVKSTTTPTPSTQQQQNKIKPIIVTAASSDENNVNIVLVPAKADQRIDQDHRQQEEQVKPFRQPTTTVQPSYIRPQSSKRPIQQQQQHHFDYTTEFTVGAVQGHGAPPHMPGSGVAAGHYVASSIVLSPYGTHDEPFRPIPRPSGMTASYQVVDDDDSPLQPDQPTRTRLPPAEMPDTHEPHEFIPSPQFHRKEEKPVLESNSPDYDFDGIQIDPKPGQYVIFPKPQLNPEINESQFKKKPEINYGTVQSKPIPHVHEQKKQETRLRVPEEVNQVKQVELEPERKPLDVEQPYKELQPPKRQTERPFVSQKQKEEGDGYPRPHWEKNGKPPSFLNAIQNKNDNFRNPAASNNNNNDPTRYRKPIAANNRPPLRKNDNVKQKQNLPNILPQFRPNAKLGTSYNNRPLRQQYNNRRNGPNRNEGFPYHLQGQLDKNALSHRDYEVEEEILPKYITHRRRVPEEDMIVQDRSGVGPMNVETRRYQEPPAYRTINRHQRMPVTTLQKLKQSSNARPHKNPVLREDTMNLTSPMVPPAFKTYKDDKNKSVYVVYPSNVQQPDRKYYNTKPNMRRPPEGYKIPPMQRRQDQYPLLNPNKRPMHTKLQEPLSGDFPYGFINSHGGEERLKLIRKEEQNKNDEIRPNIQDYTPQTVQTPETTDKIDMNLHLQNNNQWNSVQIEEQETTTRSSVTQNPVQVITKTQTPFRITDYPSPVTEPGIIINLQNPSSQYHTLKKDETGSEFTLGAVMHTVHQKHGQVANVPLEDLTQEEEEEEEEPKRQETKIQLVNLNVKVNERISNGKIVQVSMPLDTKQDEIEDRIDNAPTYDGHLTSSISEKYNFQPPFQPSMSIDTNQGWSMVQDSENSTDIEANKKKFDLENFKPQLYSGFKPIYDPPDEELVKQDAKLAAERKDVIDRDKRNYE